MVPRGFHKLIFYHRYTLQCHTMTQHKKRGIKSKINLKDIKYPKCSKEKTRIRNDVEKSSIQELL